MGTSSGPYLLRINTGRLSRLETIAMGNRSFLRKVDLNLWLLYGCFQLISCYFVGSETSGGRKARLWPVWYFWRFFENSERTSKTVGPVVSFMALTKVVKNKSMISVVKKHYPYCTR